MSTSAKPEEDKKPSKDVKTTEKTPETSSVTDGENTGSSTLSNKELKELKKKEKAAKRAAQKVASGITPEQQKQMAEQKIKQNTSKAATNLNLKKQLNQTLIKPSLTQKRIPALFSHLETREQRNEISPSISHIVHPAILTLSLKHSTYKIVGSIPRLWSMMRAFQEVIRGYKTPENNTLTRHLTGHLSHQIEYLRTARPLLISMGNAIRWLKQEISHISIDTSEDKAKEILCERIDDFIKEKIDLADQVIVSYALKHIVEGLTILTYGHSEVLELLFKFCAAEENKRFNLIVVDSRPLFEGKKLVRNLSRTLGKDQTPITQTHIKVQYALLLSLSSITLKDVSCVFLGAHAMLSNGQLYSRVGTGQIAMMCHSRNIPVLTCCESIKFSDRVQLDSVTTNELADSDDLAQSIDLKKPPQKKFLALEQFLKDKEEKKLLEKQQQQSLGKKQGNGGEVGGGNKPSEEKGLLENWKSIPFLNILNIMYDLTPPEYIQKVVTELGALPPSSVPVILREYKNT